MIGTSVSAWADLMRQSITIEPYAGAAAPLAVPAFGAPVSYRCRIVGRRRDVVTRGGETVTSHQTIYLLTADAIDPRSQVTLSTADAGSTEARALHPPILDVGRYPDENGAHHTALYL